jgi:hypothetical protein
MTEVSTGIDQFARGPQRAPENRGFRPGDDRPAPPAGSIHDDATAQKLGFRGGTIAGSVHMDQFVPVLVDVLGAAWFESGSLSLTFRHATISGDPVIAMVARPASGPPAQVEARMEQPDGTLVASGTASVGAVDEPSHLSVVDLRQAQPGALRMLADLAVGVPLASHEATISAAGLAERIAAGALTEPLDWYTGASPWGGPVANPSSVVHLLRNGPHDFGRHVAKAVGLFGAIEIRHHAGPVFLDVAYQVSGRIVALGSSPRTEYVWYDTAAHDTDGRLVATMRMQLRWMTASSPLYALD